VIFENDKVKGFPFTKVPVADDSAGRSELFNF